MTGKPKVFISYSRKDLAFADRLVAALENREIEVLIDRRDLPALEDWQRELAGFIQAADTVVFIISPHSIASKVCAWEVEQVRALAKRLAPVLIAPFEDAPIPADIARINFLSFIDEVDFEKQADALGRSLKIDIGWLKEHTRLSELAWRWHVRGKPDDALLRGQDVSDAEGRAARRPREALVATEQLLSYLDASRNAEAERLADLDAAITHMPSSSVAYNARGYAHLSKGNLDHALADFTQAISLDPKSASARNNRGLTYRKKQ